MTDIVQTLTLLAIGIATIFNALSIRNHNKALETHLKMIQRLNASSNS